MITMKTSTLIPILLLIYPRYHLIACTNANLIEAQNVFGWQKQKQAPRTSSRRHATSSSSLTPTRTSSSPLRRSENVFGWQQQQEISVSKSIDTKHKNRRASANNPKAILHTTSSTPSTSLPVAEYKEEPPTTRTINNNQKQHQQQQDQEMSPHQFNVHVGPRKKELWLPWPLGALRNDFYKFAAEQRTYGASNSIVINGAARQEWQPRNSRQQHQQQQEGHTNANGMLEQGRDWATKMLQRGGSLLPFPKLHANSDDNQQQKRQSSNGGGRTNGGRENKIMAGSSSSESSYWIKDTTTPMATASATMKKKGNGNKQMVSRGGESRVQDEESNKSMDDRDVLFEYLKLQARLRLRQLGYVGSDLSVHLPPASPILLFYYFYPSKQDPIRRLVKYTVAGAALSWMHAEATKYRRFSPLPSMRGVNVRQPNLPPFLPEEWVPEEWEQPPQLPAVDARSGSIDDSNKGKGKASKSGKTIEDNKKQPEKEKDDESDIDDENNGSWDPFQSFGTISNVYRTWLEGYNLRNKQSHQSRRIRAEDQLMALQKTGLSNSTSTSTKDGNVEAGYALVTGASSGIGRALAVELARYHIPLILVARDLTKLSAVAKDIEQYYNIPCRVLQADLNAPDCASRIHAATTAAGLNVDILVNNAGVCTHGDFIDGNIAASTGTMDDVSRMLQVNIGSAVQLSRLYGQDMKERRRGRVLFVSSMSGVLPGCPSVAVYAATKAFGKSLSMSLGREMERYGVGVTCLLPGAVRGTSFASRSEVEDAVCFHFPGYAKTPEFVAGEGITGLMLGYPEIYPGAINRAFVKMFLPLIPPRVSNIIGEWAWNPWQWGDVMPQRRSGGPNIRGMQMEDDQSSTSSLPTPSAPPSASQSSSWKFRRSSTPSNQMQLPDMPKSKSADSPELVSELPGMQMVDLVGDVAVDAGNVTAVDEPNPLPIDMKKSVDSEQMSPSGSPPLVSGAVGEADKSSVAEESDKNKKDAIIPAPQEMDDKSRMGTENKDKATSSENEATVVQAAPAPEPLVLPPPAKPVQNYTSSPLDIFGLSFFEKDNTPSKPSSGKSTTSVVAENDVAATVDQNGKIEEKTQLSKDDGEVTWYPSMMDKKEYDFRDRRLDY